MRVSPNFIRSVSSLGLVSSKAELPGQIRYIRTRPIFQTQRRFYRLTTPNSKLSDLWRRVIKPLQTETEDKIKIPTKTKEVQPIKQKNIEEIPKAIAIVKSRTRYQADEKEEPYTEKDRKRDYYKKYTVNTAIIQSAFFDDLKNKNKQTFLEAINIFIERDKKYLRGHCEFIQMAMKQMRLFGVHRDLEAYKKLLQVFPKGPMVAQSFWQVEFMHYPKQQLTAIELLDQMEDNGLMGDSDVEDILADIFGPKSHPSRKLWRMLYWMPKFKYLSPWALPDPLPDDSLELAKLAIKRITSVDPATEVSIYQSEDLEEAQDHTWVVSGQSPDQQALIESHPADRPIYVEGAFRVWLRDQCINYFILRSEPKEQPKKEGEDPDDVSNLHDIFDEKEVLVPPSVHEQEDGNILAVCATGTSSLDSVVSWIRFLEHTNPRLGKDISVLFTLKSPIGPTDTLDHLNLSAEEREAIAKDDRERGLFNPGPGLDLSNPELSQWGVHQLSDTKFRNWPHHFNRRAQGSEEEEAQRLSEASSRPTRILDTSSVKHEVK